MTIQPLKTTISRLIIAATVLASAVSEASAQSHVVRYGVEDGLSSRNCNCIAQDADGYIWIGTSNGLDRFDGHHFHHIDMGTGAANNVWSICAEGGNRLWIGTGAGLAVYDIGKGTSERFIAETEWKVGIYSKVNVIRLVGNQTLFIGTNGQGFFIHDLKSGSFRQFNRHASQVSSIADDYNGHVLIGCEEGTICEHDNDGSYIRTICSDSGTSEPRGSDIKSIAVNGREIWFSMANKGFCLMEEEGKAAPSFLKPKEVTGSFIVNCQTTGKDSNLLLGVRNGIYVFNPGNCSFRRMPLEVNGASSDFNIGYIFYDRDGGIWCTVAGGGLLYVAEEEVAYHRLMEDWEVTSIAKAQDGSYWYGTLSGNLFKAGQDGQNPVLASSAFPDIRCIMADLPEIWIGTVSDGVYVYNTQTRKSVNYRYDRYSQNSLSDNCVNSIFKDSSGKIYIGTEWGLNYFNKSRGRMRIEPRCGNNAQVTGFFEDSKNNVWIMTKSNGAFRVNQQGKGWIHFATISNPNMTSNEINCINEDGKRRIWLGTTNGLCAWSYETNSFTRYFEKGCSLSGKDIVAIEKDSKGNFWIADESEITCVNTEDDLETGVIGKSGGLNCTMFGRGVSSSTNGDIIMFGGSKGIDCFSASLARANMMSARPARKAVITEVTIGNKLFLNPSKIKVRHSDSNIVIHFSDMEYNVIGENRYFYKLESMNDSWVSSGPQLTYSRMPSGKHRFKVSTSDFESWTADGNYIDFNVLPPFYASRWAYLVYLIILAGISYGITRVIRKKRAEETYQDKYAFFTNITHEIRTPLTLIKTPLEKIIASGDGTEETRHYLKIIDKSADNLISLVNQLLDYRKNEDGHYIITKKPCNVGLVTEDIAGRFQATVAIENKRIETHFPDKSYTYEVDQSAYGKIIHNLLSNAIKYADSVIKVEMVAEEERFIVRVSNDGVRINPSEYDSIFKMFYQVSGSKAGTGIGLPLSRMLAERHGGTLTVRSDSQLTTFELTIPGTRVEMEIPETEETVAARNVIEPLENKKASVILIVDDNEDLRHMVVEMLKDQYIILQASNGKEGIGVLEKEAVDLILCDVMMPEMDGYQFCEYVKSEMRYANIPFVHITAKTDVEFKIKGFYFGADDFIEKPFSAALLLAKVKSVLDNRARLTEFYRGLPIMHPAKISKVTKSSADFIIKLRAELEKHLADENYSMSAMADSMFMSQSSFYRKVKSLTGVSPNEFVKDFRLQRSAELLSTGEYLPNEVYLKVGFNSVPYFSLCFKKKYGMSPVQYVESLKKESNGEE